MALRLDIVLNGSQAGRLKLLAGVSRTAAAKALTFTAEKAVPAWRAANHRVFHMRRTWIDRGVRMRPASAGDLNAQVGTLDRYMQRHVLGLGEEKVSAGRALFVPVYNSISEVGTHTQERAFMRRAATNKRKPFVIHVGTGKVLIVRRKGKARTPLEVLGVLQHDAHIEPHLDAQGVVAAAVQREFGPVFERVILAWAKGRNIA